jgi:hypothetical protein
MCQPNCHKRKKKHAILRLKRRQADAFYDYLNFDLHDGPETSSLLGRDIEPCGDITCHHSETFFGGEKSCHSTQRNDPQRLRPCLVCYKAFSAYFHCVRCESPIDAGSGAKIHIGQNQSFQRVLGHTRRGTSAVVPNPSCVYTIAPLDAPSN